jgi:hypothetical protein
LEAVSIIVNHRLEKRLANLFDDRLKLLLLDVVKKLTANGYIEKVPDADHDLGHHV